MPGKKFLELPKSNKGTIPRLTKHDINNLPIALPNLDVQKSILEKDEMLSKILNTLNGLKEDLSLNPMSSENEISKLNEIYDTTFISNKLVRLNSNLRKGESDIVEFKETFGLDKATSQKNKNLEFLISKTIAGFLNSNKAGTLYIGINDNAEIVGMEEEINKFYKSLDKFKLKFTDFLKHKIGEEFNVFINYEFINHTKGTVFEVSINPSDKPVYIDGDKFFYRTNPRTTELTGAKLVEYVNRRFK